MRSGLDPSGTPRACLSRALPRVGTLLVLLTVVGLLAVTPARAAWGGPASETYGWTNGSVMCVFEANAPSVTVSATGLNETGIALSIGQVNEISASGAVVASANMGSAAWNANDDSTTPWFQMNYSNPVNVTNSIPPIRTVGTVSVTLTFTLDRSPANASSADQVAVQLTIQGWPWQNPHDTLAVVVPVWSAFANYEHVVVGSPSVPRIESVRTSDGVPLEYFEAGASATTGTGVAVPVTSETTVAAGVATATLLFGSGAGNAATLVYSATLGITPSTRVLGVPLYDYAAVAGGAGLVALVVGIGTRRIRRQPSDLTYVEESE